jgi:hypothetical protein
MKYRRNRELRLEMRILNGDVDVRYSSNKYRKGRTVVSRRLPPEGDSEGCAYV